MAIVVTGASGQFGRLAVNKLLERGVDAGDIVATARDTDTITDLARAGVRTATLDYSDVDGSVFSAGDVLLLVSGNEIGHRAEQHRNVVEAAKAAGVARIAYTSVVNVASPDLVVAPEHKATEDLIVASGLPFTFLRNGWYTENYLPAFAQARENGEIVAAAADGGVSSAERAELAEAAAVVVSTEGHENKAYDLVGPIAWTHADLAKVVGDVLGAPVTYRALEADIYRDVLLGAGLDEGTVGFVVGVDRNVAAGELGLLSDDLADLIGRTPRSIAETVPTWV